MNPINGSDSVDLVVRFLDDVREGLEANQSVGPLAPAVNFVSDALAFYFKVLLYVFACGLVSVIGMATNIVNIIVFVRQGVFTESGSTSLLGLAISDFCCVTSMLWLSITFAIVLAEPAGLSWEPWDMMYLTGGWPHLMFAQITRMVTAYIALERCICVVFPFKVKSIFTPRRSLTVIAAIFVCFLLSYSPVFITQQLGFKFDSKTNSTRLVLVSHPQWQLAVDVMYYVNSITFNISAVLLVLVCTMITVSRVKLSKTWRESLAKDKDDDMQKSTKDSTSNSTQMSKSKMQKEKKLVQMITLISVIFLICYIPDLTFMLMFTVNPEIRIMGKQENLAMVMYSFTFLMETVNSTINILVYYSMSSRYKQIFRDLIGLKSS